MAGSTVSAAPATIGAAMREAGLDPVDARVLLQQVLGIPHAALLAHDERVLSEDERRRFAALAARRADGEPVAYLLGWREFYGRRFAVGPAVLVPRPETELLIDQALQRLPPAARVEMLDLGTGSGNIALTLALERPRCALTAVDASGCALAMARENARTLGAGNIEFLQGDWYGPVTDRSFDLVVSNPPYVAETDPHLGLGDLRFEPASALRAGPDGLAAIRQIVARAPEYLRANGWLLFEHGYDQAHACRSLLGEAGFVDVTTASDLAELPRVSGGRKAR
ncbi:MAG: peptide chain release factor N(5)-glutamine methyltransferase [Burkholderiales bacterium]